ncbi:universal stress protein [Okibacterium endophyticum]
MSTRTLVGIDGTSASERAVAWAATRASSCGDALHLVHVMPSGIRSAGGDDLVDAAERGAQSLVERSTERVHSIDPAIQVTSEVVLGDALDQLVKKSPGSQLLVVGDDSQDAGRQSRRGTRGFRIAAAGQVPVAVIPDIDLTGRSGVVVGVDGSDLSDHALQFAAAEADRLNEPLIAVNAWNNPVVYGYDFTFPVEYLDDLDEAGQQTLTRALGGVELEHPNLEIRRVVAEGDAALILTEQAATASLLVVGSHGRGTVARLLLGSVSHGVLSNLVAPTVVVR